MKSKRLGLIVFVFLAGAISGYFLGERKTEEKFEKLFYLGEAKQLTTSVQILSAIHYGDSKEAAKWLEHYVDGNLIVLGPYKEIALKENIPIILSSLKLASIYRDKYKDQRSKVQGENPDINASISETLAFGKQYGEITHKDFVRKCLNPNQVLKVTPKIGAP
jgi:hypothetical protein